MSKAQIQVLLKEAFTRPILNRNTEFNYLLTSSRGRETSNKTPNIMLKVNQKKTQKLRSAKSHPHLTLWNPLSKHTMLKSRSKLGRYFH